MPRADLLLVHLGLAASRTAAQRLIEAGRVSWRAVDGPRPVRRASQTVPEGCELLVATDAEADRYVSRGGWKLHGALAETGVSAQDKVCLDVGQSTGGFTDCLLQAGAAQVIGVDVGHGQLHRRLQGASQVVCIEGCNARHIDRASLGPYIPAAGFALIVGDVSFISLTLILPRLPALLAKGGSMLLLVKPQFEVGPEHLGKGGIVRNADLYAGVEDKLRQCAAACGLRVRGWLASPITGGDGNHEFFIWTEHEYT